MHEPAVVNRITPFIKAAPPPPTFNERLGCYLATNTETRLYELRQFLFDTLNSQVSFRDVPDRLLGEVFEDRRHDEGIFSNRTTLKFKADRKSQTVYVANRLLELHRLNLIGGVFAEANGKYRLTYWRTVYRFEEDRNEVIKFRVQHTHWLEDAELCREAPAGMDLPSVATRVYGGFPKWLLPERRVLVGRMTRNLIVAHEEQLYRKPLPRQWTEVGINRHDPAILLGPYVLHGWV